MLSVASDLSAKLKTLLSDSLIVNNAPPCPDLFLGKAIQVSLTYVIRLWSGLYNECVLCYQLQVAEFGVKGGKSRGIARFQYRFQHPPSPPLRCSRTNEIHYHTTIEIEIAGHNNQCQSLLELQCPI